MMTRGDSHEVQKLRDLAYQLRRNLLRLTSLKTVHIGGCLSVADIVTVLWHHAMRYNPNNPSDEGRDRFILSKGHCAATVALSQAQLGCFSVEDVMREYGTDECRFNMAPCKHRNSYYESSATGSLGQGVSIGCGMAAALKVKENQSSCVFIVAGDGEMQEGSVWEAIMAAPQLGLDNIVFMVDNNGLQFDGETRGIISMRDLSARVAAFGWEVCDVNGHNIRELTELLDSVRGARRPVFINAHTIKGCGISYMENNPAWHAGCIAPEKLNETLRDLDNHYPQEACNV